jgi:hypothetical protein
MKKITVLTAFLFLVTAAVMTVSATGRHEAVARYSARSVQMVSPVRPLFTRVDIEISQWSTDQDHRQLGRAILEQGPMAFSYALAGYPALGWIGVGDREFTIRYAWQAFDRDGGQRIYVASDEPILLMPKEFRKFADPEPLLFLELRLNARGEGIGKLSDAARLSVDQARNVIELRDFDRRPVHLVMVHDELNFYE